MRQIFTLSLSLLLLAGCAGSSGPGASSSAAPPAPAAPAPLASPAAPVSGFSLDVAGLAENARVPNSMVYNRSGCSGGDVSPALSWSGAPEGTKSFALVMFDPDAPRSGGWLHWTVLDIPASATGLPEGAGAAGGAGLPTGARQTRNDFGASAYGGPCPPVGGGRHRYEFTLYALGVEKAPEGANAAALRGQSLGQAKRTLIFGS